MKSRLVTLSILLALAFALYRLATLADRSAQPLPTGGLLYPGLETRDVDFVSLKFRTGHVLDLERQAEGPWLVTYPTDEYAQQEFAEVLVDNLARATFIPVELQGEAVRPEDVGLQPRTLQITFRRAGQLHTLYVGEMDVFGKGIYAQKEGEDHVLKVTANLRTMLEQFRDQDYVDKHLLRGLRGPVDHVRVESPEGVLLDALGTTDRWTIRAPVPGQGDAAKIRLLAQTLLRVEQLHPLDVDPLDSELAQLGLPNARQVAQGDWAGATLVQLGSGAQEPAVLFLEARWKERDTETFCVRRDLRKILVFDRHHLNLLLNEPDFFRERRLFDPVRERARGVRLEVRGEPVLDIRRDERSRWTFFAPARQEGLLVDSERVDGRSLLSDFLGSLDALSAIGFEAPASGEPEATLVLDGFRAGSTQRETVQFFGLSREAVSATCSQRPGEGLRLERAAVVRLLDPTLADTLRSLAPIDLDPERWAGLEIRIRDEAPLGIQRQADGWSGDDPWGRRFGLGHDLLRSLRGLAWRVARDGVEYPWRVTFLAADGSGLGELAVRLPEALEPAEVSGRAVAFARWSGVSHMELVVPRDVVTRVEGLLAPLAREP